MQEDNSKQHFPANHLNQKKIHVKKGTILQMQGDANIKSFFVEKGLLRSYLIDAKGKEHTYIFAPENWIVGDFAGLSEQKTAQLFVDVLEDSDIIVYDVSNIDPFKDLSPEDYKKGFTALIKRVNVLQQRILMNMSATALERYEHFVETYPDIIERVPQKMIATYLGITPEALSKVRRKLSKK